MSFNVSILRHLLLYKNKFLPCTAFFTRESVYFSCAGKVKRCCIISNRLQLCAMVLNILLCLLELTPWNVIFSNRFLPPSLVVMWQVYYIVCIEVSNPLFKNTTPSFLPTQPPSPLKSANGPSGFYWTAPL